MLQSILLSLHHHTKHIYIDIQLNLVMVWKPIWTYLHLFVMSSTSKTHPAHQQDCSNDTNLVHCTISIKTGPKPIKNFGFKPFEYTWSNPNLRTGWACYLPTRHAASTVSMSLWVTASAASPTNVSHGEHTGTSMFLLPNTSLTFHSFESEPLLHSAMRGAIRAAACSSSDLEVLGMAELIMDIHARPPTRGCAWHMLLRSVEWAAG
jgi:hypothetical protein